MSSKQKDLQAPPAVESNAASRQPTAMPMPIPIGVPAPFQLDAHLLSRLGADLPTIQALLGTPVSPGQVDARSTTASQPSGTTTIGRSAPEGLLNHSPEWMAAIGRIGGLSRSPAKSRAARLNGAKGGRPRKTDARPAVSGEGPHDVVRISSGNSLPPNGDSLSEAG